MSASDESERRSNATEEGDSVLAKLPRTRPQRSSPRRAAARRTAAGNGRLNGEATDSLTASSQRGQAGAKASSAKSRRTPRTGAASKTGSGRASASSGTSARRDDAFRVHEPIPMQGFEADGERARGPVHPPGGAELFASAVEMIGDLTKSSVASGERLVRDLFGRLLP